MARIICLADSGFGKSTGTGKLNIPELGINFIGLNPENSYILSTTTKPLPYKGSAKMWPIAPLDNLRAGRRCITKTPDEVVKALQSLLNVPADKVKNIVIDDFNYLMQDWYMDNALRTGWDAPKTIGVQMGKVFKEIEKFEGYSRNIFVLAHAEYVSKSDGRLYAKLKTTGKMVDEYVTPEGKFDLTLVGKSHYDTKEKRVVKQYVTNEDEHYSSPKTPLGMFTGELYISNDLGYVEKKIDEFYVGE